MGEKGFATIFALCLILATALVFKGIQESESNHANETANFLAEAELQNAADSAIYIAAEKVLSKEVELELNQYYNFHNSRQNAQHDFDTITKNSERIGTITVKSWGERIAVQSYTIYYGSDDENSSSAKLNIAGKVGKPKKVYLFSSVAEATNKQTGKKIYRRAVAYMLEDGSDTTVNFMEVPMSSYTIKD